MDPLPKALKGEVNEAISSELLPNTIKLWVHELDLADKLILDFWKISKTKELNQPNEGLVDLNEKNLFSLSKKVKLGTIKFVLIASSLTKLNILSWKSFSKASLRKKKETYLKLQNLSC